MTVKISCKAAKHFSVKLLGDVVKRSSYFY